MNPDLTVQIAIRERLTGTPGVTALVPAGSIIDANQRPAPSPSIILGECQTVDEGTSLRRAHVRVYHTLHVWKREGSLEGVKTICGAVRQAINTGRLILGDGLHCADQRISNTRVLRDPGGEYAHGVLTVEVLVSGAAA